MLKLHCSVLIGGEDTVIGIFSVSVTCPNGELSTVRPETFHSLDLIGFAVGHLNEFFLLQTVTRLQICFFVWVYSNNIAQGCETLLQCLETFLGPWMVGIWLLDLYTVEIFSSKVLPSFVLK